MTWLDWLGLTAFVAVVAVPWVWGVGDLYTAWRFRRSAGGRADRTAFLLNWFALKWSLVSNAGRVAEALPFMQRDLSENFGVRPDDGRVT